MTAVAPRQRLISLDALRGLSVALMILVNSSDSRSWPCLHHAYWNGFTVADTVYPTFLLVVGCAIQLSLGGRLAHGSSPTSLVPSILRRSVIIFLLGTIIVGFPHYDLHSLRVMGVLQRIALCYLITALLFIYGRTTRFLAVTTAVLLVGYWALLRFVPVPGCGHPVRDFPILDFQRNIVYVFDHHFFADARMYHNQGRVFEPESLLSTWAAIATTLFGVLTARWLQSPHSPAQKLRGLWLAAFAGLALGAAWNPWFPINKSLWTSSFALFAAGVTLTFFALFYWWFDVRARSPKPLWPLLAFGSNAVFIYTFSELGDSVINLIHTTSATGHTVSIHSFISSSLHHHIAYQPVASLCWALLLVFAAFIPAALLYRFKIFIKV